MHLNSRYASSCFCVLSKIWFHCMNISACPGSVPIRRQFGFSETFRITFFSALSTSRNIFASVGSWRWISGAEKIGSRYIQFFCTNNHSSSTFCVDFSADSIFSTSCRIPVTNREARIVPIVTCPWHLFTCLHLERGNTMSCRKTPHHALIQ